MEFEVGGSSSHKRLEAGIILRLFYLGIIEYDTLPIDTELTTESFLGNVLPYS